ncbi:unnamed protein product [Linum trigynum]|uniref:Uncharacterized protein n=1 Tax=Linum trigynum TaxID=586398 RepID=A0AAV2FLD5_9ROSI
MAMKGETPEKKEEQSRQGSSPAAPFRGRRTAGEEVEKQAKTEKETPVPQRKKKKRGGDILCPSPKTTSVAAQIVQTPRSDVEETTELKAAAAGWPRGRRVSPREDKPSEKLLTPRKGVEERELPTGKMALPAWKMMTEEHPTNEEKVEGASVCHSTNPMSRELDPRIMAAGLSMGRSDLQWRLSLGHGREKCLRRPGQQLVWRTSKVGPVEWT